MGETRKFILDRFQDYLDTSFGTFCEKHGLEKNDRHMVTFLIEQNLISETQLQRYTVLKEYERISKEPRFPKVHAVEILANRFFISPRTVWNILKNVKSTNRINSEPTPKNHF